MRRIAALAVLFALGGCAKQSQCTVIPFTGIVPQLVMISPAPGTTGLPVSGVTVQISYDPPQGSLRLAARGSGAVVIGGPLTLVPAPGNAPPGARIVVSALPTLAAGTTYDVFVDAVYTVQCMPGVTGVTTYPLGSLATQ